jgi:tyrosyl-tRNA synthetase
MVPLMSLFWMYLHGFQAVTLLGGSTASVGDPTGRKTEREKMDNIERKVNIVRMHKQLQLLWVHVEELGRKHGFEWRPTWKRALLNNNFWLNKVSVQEVLKLMGGGLRMGTLLNRDSYVFDSE